MVVEENPDAAGFLNVPVDLQGPAFEGRFAFPEEPAVAIESTAVAVVTGRDVAEKTDVKEVSRAGPEGEWRKIALVERAEIAPNPADSVALEKVDDLRAVPASVPEIDRGCSTIPSRSSELTS